VGRLCTNKHTHTHTHTHTQTHTYTSSLREQHESVGRVCSHTHIHTHTHTHAQLPLDKNTSRWGVYVHTHTCCLRAHTHTPTLRQRHESVGRLYTLTHTHTHTHTHTYIPLPADNNSSRWGEHVHRKLNVHITNTYSYLPMQCVTRRGGGLGSSTIFKKFNEPYAPS